ncbi:hypothetical protein [Terricaulis sp.]|uniref:hypothetical protein n=1 Tax=Terricaulis sp. TaxID=2768686 RepID=UPI003784DB8D
MKRLLVALAALVALGAAPASAEPIFSETFQDGDAGGWSPSGGDVRLTTYATNVSMRFTRRAAAVAGVSTRGFSEVTVAASFAALDLEGDDYCLVEASGDGGRTWVEVLRVRDGEDDGVVMHRSAVRDQRFDDVERLLIGARISGNAENDQCWLDDVTVSGTRVIVAGPRTELTPQTLRGSSALNRLAPMQAFAPAADAGAPGHSFAGVLHVTPQARDGQMRVIVDSFGIRAQRALRVDVFPAFDITLVQDGATLIPAQRGPIAVGHPNWDIAIEPGRAWSEPGDDGWTRAALPFALIEANANCTHNGVLSFLFRDGEISRVAWEIASETCAYFQADFWGLSAARYEQSVVANGAALIAAFHAERAGRVPVQPISQLAAAGFDVAAFGSPGDVRPDALTTFGVIYNGVHYRGGCDTRAGPYPFCEGILAPSYSLAKTLVGGLGLMRLEQLHPGAMNERIAAQIAQCATWGEVTLGNALDMGTGRYNSTVSEADEAALTTSRFFLSTTLAEKLNIACGLYPRREAPGQRWVYHTPDTFLLGAGMAAYWRAQHGPQRDFFDDVLVDGVYAPLHLSPVIAATRRTADAAQQPFTGWGLTLVPDDIAKVASFLQHPPDGQALIAQAQLEAAMQRAPGDTGLEAGGAQFRYNNGLWAWNAQASLQCAHPVWIPFMSGFGGIVVAMMPNGLTYYYWSDGGEYRWARAVRAADRVAPLCEARQ